MAEFGGGGGGGERGRGGGFVEVERSHVNSH